VENTSRSAVYGIDLVGANQLSVYAEIEMLAPGTTLPLDVILPPGRYTFECESFSGTTLYSRPESVSGPAVSGAHPYVPVSEEQIQLATLSYNKSLLPMMHQLEVNTDALDAAVNAGNLDLAKSLWLPAHLDYERLGAAYDTFGNFNSEINGHPLGLNGGVNSPHFVGFLRLEYGLWHGQSVARLMPIARALDVAVHGLVTQFPQMLTPANDLSLRTHEILENTLQFELTGETDEGSHTNLATAWANTQGVGYALRALTPLLKTADPSLLTQVNAGLHVLQVTLRSFETPQGRWIALQSLAVNTRERLDSEIGGLLEQLSLIPDLLDLPIRPVNGED
jgi:high-affinity iron transporter